MASGNNYGAQNANNQTNPHRSTFISESMGGITVSQSLGVDPSVDSLALEDYDYIEPVERVNYWRPDDDNDFIPTKDRWWELFLEIILSRILMSMCSST